jgi:hypothetical protein
MKTRRKLNQTGGDRLLAAVGFVQICADLGRVRNAGLKADAGRKALGPALLASA